MRQLTCAEVDDAAAGYALDILEPEPRAAVVAHLSGCVPCREMVARTKAAADRLLDVGSGGYAPPEPVWRPPKAESRPGEPDGPAGWTGSWAGRSGTGRIGAPGGPWADGRWSPDGEAGDWATDGTEHWDHEAAGAPVRASRRRLRAAVAMTAVMALVVGTTLGPELEQSARPVMRPTLSASLTAATGTAGSVRVYAGQPTLLEVEIVGLHASGAVKAALVDAAGRVDQLGEIRLVHGHADWAAPEPGGMPDPTELLITATDGRVVATAAL